MIILNICNNNVYEAYKFVQFPKGAIHFLPLDPTLKIQFIHALPKKIERTVQAILKNTFSSFKSYPTTAAQSIED